MPEGMKPPSFLFEKPMCAEVVGAGFQKLPASEVRRNTL
jgi:DNA ligase-4